MDQELRKLSKCIDTIRNYRAEMHLQQVSMLVHIALHEGVTLPDLAEALNTTVASISRNAKQLSLQVRTMKYAVQGLSH